MRTMVTIARALKEKNRVAGRLAKARELVGAENSKDKSVPRGVDVAAMYDLAKVLRNRLIAIKSAIAEANKPIVSKIIELDEIKSKQQVLDEVAALQARADRIQDELDDFNATTKVEIEVDE